MGNCCGETIVYRNLARQPWRRIRLTGQFIGGMSLQVIFRQRIGFFAFRTSDFQKYFFFTSIITVFNICSQFGIRNSFAIRTFEFNGNSDYSASIFDMSGSSKSVFGYCVLLVVFSLYILYVSYYIKLCGIVHTYFESLFPGFNSISKHKFHLFSFFFELLFKFGNFLQNIMVLIHEV